MDGETFTTKLAKALRLGTDEPFATIHAKDPMHGDLSTTAIDSYIEIKQIMSLLNFGEKAYLAYDLVAQFISLNTCEELHEKFREQKSIVYAKSRNLESRNTSSDSFRSELCLNTLSKVIQQMSSLSSEDCRGTSRLIACSFLRGRVRSYLAERKDCTSSDVDEWYAAQRIIRRSLR